jgi:hypothetical protein
LRRAGSGGAGRGRPDRDGALHLYRPTAKAISMARRQVAARREMAWCSSLRRTAPRLRCLHSFSGGTSDGVNPQASLIADSSGNLYGTRPRGGAPSPSCSFFPTLPYVGCGVVFKLAGTGVRAAAPPPPPGPGPRPCPGCPGGTVCMIRECCCTSRGGIWIRGAGGECGRCAAQP